MNLRKLLSALLIALFLVPTLPFSALADEGMWPFNNVPKAEIKQRYGVDITDSWLRKVQLSSVRFNNGGSGSFVSANGLVMTNHHVAADTLAKLSTPEKDYVKDGFYARTRTEELKAPDLELNVLVDITDVTDRVNANVKPGMSAAEANAARNSAINSIAEESRNATGLRGDVVTLYQGGQYHLYLYKKYTDVRLVFAPEVAIAFFGGDPDNFEYPRYCLDIAFFRVYENDKPARVEDYLKWSRTGARNNELVFVAGHPGSTGRLNTMAHLEYLRDTGLPFLVKWFERRRAALLKYSKLGEEQERRARDDLFGIENALKLWRGQLKGLRDQSLMSRKVKWEENLRRSIASDPEKRSEFGGAWDVISKARKGQVAYERERRFLEGTAGINSELFSIARRLVRLAIESEKPNTERLPEYTDARRESLELELYSPAPIYEDLETIKLEGSLAFMRDELSANHAAVKKVLQGKNPEERAKEFVEGTKLKDVEQRKQLAAGGIKAVEESTDPMIVLARSIDDDARAVRKRYEDEVVGVERANYAKIARALFELEGTDLYPDATFTLRLAFGPVRGYVEDGKNIPPFTNFAGLYKRAALNGNKPPYQLPAIWEKRRRALNLQTPFNFVAAVDSTGGNSGSPVINKDGELVGILFDGNIHSLIGDFIYDETQNRSVCVDSRGIIEALRKIYRASELVNEFLARS